MNDVAFKVLGYVVSIAVVVITAYVVPYIKTRIGDTKLAEIEFWVQRSVEAAEVMFRLPKSGEEKLAYVTNLVAEKFNKKKVVITSEQLRALIESAVRTMNESSTK